MNSVKYDWLTLTKVLPNRETGPIHSPSEAMILAKAAWGDLGITGGELLLEQGKPRYPFVWLHVDSQTLMCVSNEPWKQGLMFIASGRAMDEPWRIKGYMDGAREHAWTCTRLDVAVDFHDGGVTVADIYFAHRKEQPDDRKKRSFTQGRTGDTFALGSRSSNKFLRVYDKAGQQGVPGDWIRVEMEYKGDGARTAFAACRDGIESLAGDIAVFLGPTLTVVGARLHKLAAGTDTALSVGRKINTDRERWIRGTVVPAWKKWAHEQPGDAWQALYDLLKEISDIVSDPA